MSSSAIPEAALLRRIQELQTRCENQQQITSTDFLDGQTAAQLKNYLKSQAACPHVFSGGYPDAERQVLFFLPGWQDKDTFQPEWMFKFLKIIPADAKGLTHRDYLGSLMSLGIKREKMGDILILNDGAELIVLPGIVPYLSSNITRIGRTSAQVLELEAKDLIIPERSTTTFTRTVASLRCDSVISAAFALPRSEAVAAIHKGLVSVNHIPEEKPGRILPPGCLLSVRGKGRAHIETEQNLSRKGRIFIQIIRGN